MTLKSNDKNTVLQKRSRAGLLMGSLKGSLALISAAGLPAGAAPPPASTGAAAARVSTTATITVTIDAQPLGEALNEFARQSGLQVVYFSEVEAGLRAPRVAGILSADDVLRQLLAGTPLTYEFIDARTVAIRLPKRNSGEAGEPTAGDATAQPTNRQLAQFDPDDVVTGEPAGASPVIASGNDDRSALSADLRGIPEVLVQGSKILNMDIARSRDDAQPYVIYERESIEKSGATNLQEFLKQRLPMNTQGTTSDQVPASNGGNLSQINLRGLGTSQTLVLLDGHRMSSAVVANTPMQADINGIPLAAIERIEVLPTTASGIYGGSATGGVVNVVLRRDYQGVESKVTYADTFASGAGTRQVDVAAGYSFNDGATSLLIAGSYSDTGYLKMNERDLAERGRAAIVANNPGFYYSATSPSVGATPNIRSVSGENLTLKDGTALNSSVTSVPVGYAGAATDGGAALVANAGRYNFDLADSAQYFGNSGGGRSSIMNNPNVKSATATLRHAFSPRVQAFLDAGASRTEVGAVFSLLSANMRVAAAAPNNPFRQDVIVAFPSSAADQESFSRTESLRAVAGVVIALPADWNAGIDYAWSRSTFRYEEQFGIETAQLSAAVRNGTVDVLRDTQLYAPDLSQYVDGPAGYAHPGSATLRDVTARISGPLFELPAGAVTLSAALEHRDERVGEGDWLIVNFPDTAQTVESAYVELRAPLASALSQPLGIRDLELQIAGRYDRYKTDGANLVILGSNAPVVRGTNKMSSVNPTFSLLYRPVEDIALRASFGTGFLPPDVTQLAQSSSVGATIIDPRRGNTQVSLPIGTIASGGNPNLSPEESDSWSAGLVWTPRIVPGLRLSLDYVNIDKVDIIAAPGAQALADNESIFSDRVIRGPKNPGDPDDWAGPIIALDNRLANFATAHVTAYDFAVDYSTVTTPFGSFTVFGAATLQPDYETKFLPSSPVVENVGITRGNPLKVKANAGLTWSLRQWGAGWSARYFDSYLVANPAVASSAPVILNQGNERVPSQTYHDIFVSYSGVRGGRVPMLDSMDITLGIKNVFDTKPPFDASNVSSGYYSTFGDARLASYYLSLKVNF